MSLTAKKWIIAALGFLFLGSLVLVQWMEVARREVEAGLAEAPVVVPDGSGSCVACHGELTPGIIGHWEGSTHAKKGVGCVECHQAERDDVDAFSHYGALIATVVTPLDCARCHKTEFRKSY